MKLAEKVGGEFALHLVAKIEENLPLFGNFPVSIQVYAEPRSIFDGLSCPNFMQMGIQSMATLSSQIPSLIMITR